MQETAHARGPVAPQRAALFWAVAPSDQARALAVKGIVALAMLVGMLLSPRLWLSARDYPLTPVWDRLPTIPTPLDTLWFVTLVGLLVAVALLPRSWARVALWLFVGPVLVLALWDQSRWQPWAYQYVFMLLFLAGYDWSASADEPRSQGALNACRVVLASTYLWSGLQKFNVSFATSVFPFIIEPILPPGARPFAQHGALLIPVVETSIGIALLLPWSRNIAVLLGLVMHLGVLASIGPWGHNWNTVVWPWNLAMMALLVALFWRTPRLRAISIVRPGRSALHWLALALFGVMPAFSFFGRWDAYLSAALYSGNTVAAQITVSPAAYQGLPDDLRSRMHRSESGLYELDTLGWSIDELNVPPYPAARLYRRLALHLATQTSPADVGLTIESPPHWLSGQRTLTVLRGDELNDSTARRD